MQMTRVDLSVLFSQGPLAHWKLKAGTLDYVWLSDMIRNKIAGRPPTSPYTFTRAVSRFQSWDYGIRGGQWRSIIMMGR